MIKGKTLREVLREIESNIEPSTSYNEAIYHLLTAILEIEKVRAEHDKILDNEEVFMEPIEDDK